ELHRAAVQHLLRARQDHSAYLVDDLRLCLVHRQWADVTPVERQRASTGYEQSARVSDVVVQLIWWAELGQRLVYAQSLGRRGVVVQGLHVVRVEEGALLGALALDEGGRDGAVHPVGLRAALHRQAGNVVAHPLWVEHRRVVRVRLGREVGQELLIEVGEGNGDDRDLCAGQPLELRSASLQRLGDLRPGEGQDADGDAAELVV